MWLVLGCIDASDSESRRILIRSFAIYKIYQDLRTFVPLQNQPSRKMSPKFAENFRTVHIFFVNFVVFRTDFDENSSEFQ